MSRSLVADLEVALGRRTIHPFPARMAPSLALKELSRLKRNAVVLDPMVGSGTVVAIARSKGHRAIGYDVDPLAAMMSRVWTRIIEPNDVRRKAIWVLKRAKNISCTVKVRDAYPRG